MSAIISTPSAHAPQNWTTKALLVVGLCFAINMVDGMDVNILSLVAAKLQSGWHVAPDIMGYVFSAGLAGMAFGGTLIAPLADKFGRRKIILLALTLMSLGMVACGYVPNIGWLFAARVLVGAGIGTVLATMAALTAEAAPASKQTFAVGAVQAGYPFASVFTAFIVAATLPHWGWQNMLLGAGVFTCLMLPLAYFALPESEAHASVHQENVPVGVLFNATYRTRSILLWCATFFGLMVLYFITSWITILSIKAGLSQTNGIYAGATYNGGAFIGTMLVSFFSMRVPLTKLVPGAMIMAAISMLIFGTVVMPIALTLFMALLIGVSLQGGYNGVWPLAASLYPVECRATGIGWAIGVGRGGAVVGPILGGYLMRAHTPLWGIFAIFCIPIMLCAISVWALRRVAPVQH